MCRLTQLLRFHSNLPQVFQSIEYLHQWGAQRHCSQIVSELTRLFLVVKTTNFKSSKLLNEKAILHKYWVCGVEIIYVYIQLFVEFLKRKNKQFNRKCKYPRLNLSTNKIVKYNRETWIKWDLRYSFVSFANLFFRWFSCFALAL